MKSKTKKDSKEHLCSCCNGAGKITITCRACRGRGTTMDYDKAYKKDGRTSDR